MKCSCGRFVTPQSLIVSKDYHLEEKLCFHCLSESLKVPYQELLDRYMGYYKCRTCLQDESRREQRKKWLGLG